MGRVTTVPDSWLLAIALGGLVLTLGVLFRFTGVTQYWLEDKGRTRAAAAREDVGDEAEQDEHADQQPRAAGGGGGRRGDDRRALAKEEKKRQKAELKRFAAAQREEKRRRAEARQDKVREREAARQEVEDAERAELEAKKAQLEAAASAELDGWKRDMVVDAEGEGAVGASGSPRARSEERTRSVVAYVRREKVVSFDSMAQDFNMSPREAMRIIQELQTQGTLSGVFDDRGKFITVDDKELEALADYVNKRGRLTLEDFTARANDLISARCEEEDGTQGDSPAGDGDVGSPAAADQENLSQS